jgi:hypothetical protein
MKDVWANWGDANLLFVIDGHYIHIREFVDEDGDGFTVASTFNPNTNIAKAIFQKHWQ